jgi:hypothetical protein
VGVIAGDDAMQLVREDARPPAAKDASNVRLLPREECPVQSARRPTRFEVDLFETCSTSSFCGRKPWRVKALMPPASLEQKGRPVPAVLSGLKASFA